MEKKKKALVLGATGLVGKCIVDELIADESIGSIVLFLRRSSGITNNKITEHIVDFENFASFKELISSVVIYIIKLCYYDNFFAYFFSFLDCICSPV